MHNGNAIDWIRTQKTGGAHVYDFIFVDAFDGENEIPSPFTAPGLYFPAARRLCKENMTRRTNALWSLPRMCDWWSGMNGDQRAVPKTTST